MNKIVEWFFLAFKSVDNIFSLMLFRLGIINEMIIRTKTLGDFKVKNNKNKILIIISILKFQVECLNENVSSNKISEFKNFINQVIEDREILSLENIQFFNSNINVLFEGFFDEGNVPFSSTLKNQVIIDIGGNIADTALYFASQDATVYAFEPVPPIYELALKNIDLNPNLKEKIHYYNKAVSGEDGKLEISFEGDGQSEASSTYIKKGKIYEVDCISLDNVIRKLKDQNINTTLLKLDCEGSEYDIIPNSDLYIFNEIIVEHHQMFTGIDYNVLIDELKNQGFKIDKIFSWGGYNIEELGLIRAIKINSG